MGKIKTICKSNELAEADNIEVFRKIVGKPRFYCKKCLRVAAKKAFLCKPERLFDKADTKSAETK